MIQLMLLLQLLLLSPDVGAQGVKIKVQCQNRQQSRSLWQTCHMFLTTTGSYSNQTLKSELRKFVKSSDLSTSCFDIDLFPYPDIHLQVDKALIEFTITNVLSTLTSLVEINCTRSSYSMLDVTLQSSTNRCLLQPVPSDVPCRIEDMEINISFSKDDPVATFSKTQNSQGKGEEQCLPEKIPGIKYKFYVEPQECETIKKIQSSQKTDSSVSATNSNN